MKALGVLFLVLLVVLIGSWAAGWVEFSTETNAAGTDVRMHFDNDEIEDDTERAKAKVKNATESIFDEDEAALEGTVLAVGPSSMTLTGSDGESVTCTLGPGTEVVVGGVKADVAALAEGDAVQVFVVEEGTKLVAQRVVVSE